MRVLLVFVALIPLTGCGSVPVTTSGRGNSPPGEGTVRALGDSLARVTQAVEGIRDERDAARTRELISHECDALGVLPPLSPLLPPDERDPIAREQHTSHRELLLRIKAERESLRAVIERTTTQDRHLLVPLAQVIEGLNAYHKKVDWVLGDRGPVRAR